MNIDTFLDNILTEPDGEEVCDNIIDCADVLNIDGFLDISSEKTAIQSSPIGKEIKSGIDSILDKFANYVSNKKIVLVSQEEYNSMSHHDDNILYAIRRPNKCCAVSLDDSLEYYDPYVPAVVPPTASFWDFIEYRLPDKNPAIFIGVDFGIETIEAEKFNNSKLAKIVSDLDSYTIQTKAFFNCNDLRKAYLGAGVTAIASDAFEGCHNIEIVIDKETDSILGAPWGATNATVIWRG